MRYIDWISLAYRLRCLNSYLLANADMIFELDAEGNPIKASTTLKSLILEFTELLEANIEQAPTYALNKEMYFSLLAKLDALLSNASANSAVVQANLEGLISVIESKGILGYADTKSDLTIYANGLDVIILEVLININNILDMTLNALLSITYSIALTTFATLESLDTAVLSDTMYKVLTLEFDLDVLADGTLSRAISWNFDLPNQLSISSNTEELHPSLLSNSQDYILQITTITALYVLRKIIQAYPDKLTDIQDIKILDYYEIEQGGN